MREEPGRSGSDGHATGVSFSIQVGAISKWQTFGVFCFQDISRVPATAVNQVDKVRFSHTYVFADFFKGFDKVEAVKGIFGEKTEEVLKNLRSSSHGLAVTCLWTAPMVIWSSTQDI